MGLTTSPSGGSTSLTVGATPLTSGTATRLLYETSGNVVGEISGATSDGTALTLIAPVLGTPASGTLTNATGLPVSGITASTSTALGVGSIELGHASDTTLSRLSSGVAQVEGVTIDTASNTLTLTNKTLTSPKIGTSILDTSGNILSTVTPTASAVNYLTITNSVATTGPIIAVDGSDAAISLNLNIKGTGSASLITNAANFRMTNSNANIYGRFYNLQPYGGSARSYIESTADGNVKFWASDGSTPASLYGAIAGVITVSNAAAGNVGEYISASVIQGSATSLTTATPKTVTSISLTAGDWDVTAVGSLTGASTGTEFDVAISANTNSFTGTVLGDTRCQTPTVSLTGADASLMIPSARINVSSTTIYYLVVQETFTIGTPAAYGRISARRIR